MEHMGTRAVQNALDMEQGRVVLSLRFQRSGVS